MKALKKYSITLLIGLAAVALLLWLKDIFTQTDPQAVFHILSDAFFAVGVVISGIGLLIFASNEGSFDIIVYGVSSFADMFRPSSVKKYETFYDYRASRVDKKHSFAFILISGLFFIAVALIMYLFYRRYS